VQGLKRIRVSSLDPNEVSERLLRKMAASSKVTRHLHIAIQSGDERILAGMRRPYGARDICRIFEMVEDILGEEVGLGTDILVGFPGEDEIAFENTYRLVERGKFTYLHLFPFSPRPKTEAFSMKPVVPQTKVKDRLEALRAVSSAKKMDFHERYMGRILEVLVEHHREKQDQKLTGLTGNYLRVFFDGGEDLKGRLVNVEISSRNPLGLTGKLV
jgi:threonylcarbamoyladenosine tRNA methylthiotransferase MtaB